MINVVIFKDKTGNIGRYKISGHADYDVKGKDIVCAAVSILAQTTLISLVEVCGLDENALDYEIIEKHGIIDVKLPDVIDEDIRTKTKVALGLLEIGINAIQKNYPEYVTLEYGEV